MDAVFWKKSYLPMYVVIIYPFSHFWLRIISCLRWVPGSGLRGETACAGRPPVLAWGRWAGMGRGQAESWCVWSKGLSPAPAGLSGELLSWLRWMYPHMGQAGGVSSFQPAQSPGRNGAAAAASTPELGAWEPLSWIGIWPVHSNNYVPLRNRRWQWPSAYRRCMCRASLRVCQFLLDDLEVKLAH